MVCAYSYTGTFYIQDPTQNPETKVAIQHQQSSTGYWNTKELEHILKYKWKVTYLFNAIGKS